jgi:hypothetical protein
MATTVKSVVLEPIVTKVSQTPLRLNGFELSNCSELRWPVQILDVILKDGEPQTHEDLGKLRNIIWSLRMDHKSACRGYGFVVDAGKCQVAIPSGWKLPLPIENSQFSVRLHRELVADVSTHVGRRIVCAIVREAIKKHFKDGQTGTLGPLWQDFNGFAQVPSQSSTGYIMCRRFAVQLKEIAEGRLLLQCNVGTLTVDNLTIEQHYLAGTVLELYEMIETKRAGRTNRDNRPFAIRALHQFPSGGVQAVEIADCDDLVRDSRLPALDQAALAPVKELQCTHFPKPPVRVPASELRLILDSQITAEEHGETIIEPTERMDWIFKIRNFIDGMDAFGCKLSISARPFAPSSDTVMEILPPMIAVRGRDAHEIVIPVPRQFGEHALLDRARSRADHIRQNGFLVRRPINPVLAFPKRLGEKRAVRMKRDLETIWNSQGVGATFGLCVYDRVEDIHRFVESNNNDSMLAVLPEGSDGSIGGGEDTYDRIKRRIEVPSQCLQHNHTLPSRLADLSAEELRRKEPKKSRRVTQTYELCLANLLVKHNCFPFAPREPFQYNVQVGLDVGGVHNSDVMACLGYGFRNPQEGIILLPEEIPVAVAKKEPIPTDSLYAGLLAIFDKLHSELTKLGVRPDLSTTIFYRDGQLLGDGEAWNERDALLRVHRELMTRGWITEASTWTAVEVLKGGHGWRLFREAHQYLNPIVGQCCFPFDNPSIGLVATTGAPYLTQGTAQPLCIRIHDINGLSDRTSVVTDLIWQADLCFTKVDMGMSLPWVLNVADTGALQLSRSYHITGITA